MNKLMLFFFMLSSILMVLIGFHERYPNFGSNLNWVVIFYTMIVLFILPLLWLFFYVMYVQYLYYSKNRKS